jgi:hypothetical protein
MTGSLVIRIRNIGLAAICVATLLLGAYLVESVRLTSEGNGRRVSWLEGQFSWHLKDIAIDGEDTHIVIRDPQLLRYFEEIPQHKDNLDGPIIAGVAPFRATFHFDKGIIEFDMFVTSHSFTLNQPEDTVLLGDGRFTTVLVRKSDPSALWSLMRLLERKNPGGE